MNLNLMIVKVKVNKGPELGFKLKNSYLLHKLDTKNHPRVELLGKFNNI